MITYYPNNFAYIENGILYEPFLLSIHETIPIECDPILHLLDWFIKWMRTPVNNDIYQIKQIVSQKLQDKSDPVNYYAIGGVEIVKKALAEKSIILRGFNVYQFSDLPPVLEIRETVYKDAGNEFLPAKYHKNNKVIGLYES